MFQSALCTPMFCLVGVALYLTSCIRILSAHQCGVIFRGRRVRRQQQGPGLILMWWPMESLVRVNLRTQVEELPAYYVTTQENASIKVNAAVSYCVTHPLLALEVEDVVVALSQVTRNSIRNLLQHATLEEVLNECNPISLPLLDAMNQQTASWGINVQRVEVTYGELPDSIRLAMVRKQKAKPQRWVPLRRMRIHRAHALVRAETCADRAAHS